MRFSGDSCGTSLRFAPNSTGSRTRLLRLPARNVLLDSSLNSDQRAHMYDTANANQASAADLVNDLRSDTVTKPSPAMRRAMFEAEVGDDVYAEDPTINRLEKRAAEVFGREAALFVPSGTMGNQIAIKLHTHHGQEIICEERGHVFNYEMAMMAHFSGVVPRTVWAEDGILTWQHVQSRLKTKSYHAAKTGLVSLENTHNIAGGTITPLDIFDEVCDQVHG